MASLTITLIGGPTALIELGGLRFLTDPTFEPPGEYASGAITLTKLAGPALAAADLGTIDAVLLSHDQHADNLDPAGRALLGKAGRVFTTRAGAERLGGGADGLAPWESRALAAAGGRILTVTATPARHGPAGIEPIAGEVVGFVLSLEGARPVYLTGDTVWYDGVAEVARRFAAGVVMPFAGAAQTRGPFRLTMDTNDAIETAHHFPGATIVPLHHDGWAHFSQNSADFEKAFQTLGLGGRLRLPQPGATVEIEL
ncbi:MAG TPA: MBL fold metallo-hydrolase [Hyphomicrobiales bacterium]|nr:MBL fold metallo-hydrolase [Hyphomicrobiales bacterium]